MSSPLSLSRISDSQITALEQDLVKIDLSYSPTAKSKLIEALRTGRSLEDINIDPFTPLDLVVYIYALLKTSGIADKKKAIIRALLELSQKFTTMAHYSKVNWQSLLGLLRKNPTSEELIVFLQSDHAGEPDTMDFTFFCATWTELAELFNYPNELYELGLEETFLKEMAASWVSTCEHAEITVDTLLFAYYLSGGPRFDNWDQKMLISNHSYQEFIIKVIATCKTKENAHTLLLECSNCYQDTSWQWAATLSENALLSLIEIFKKGIDPRVDQLICVHILDNQFATLATKLALVSAVMSVLPTLNLQMLRQLFVCLTRCLNGAEMSARVEVGKLYVLLLNKTWHLDLVVCTTETENVYKEYCSFSGTCLTNFITLTESLYEDGANYVDSFLIKYFMAFVDNLLTLESFVVSKSIQLKTVNEALIKIKEAAIRTLFKVYNLLEWSELKKTIFNYLSKMLVKIDFTGLPEEFMVRHYKSNDGKYTMLGFGFEDVSTQYVIVDQLPTEDV